jgi:DNA modification methylase
MTKGRQSGESRARGSMILRGNLSPTLSTRVIWQQIADLRPFPNNARCHPEKQIKTLARSISRLGWARPIVIDDAGTILCGHGCFAAAKHLSLQTVPTLAITGMTHAEKLALVIADNKVAEGSWFENDVLKLNFQELDDLSFEIEDTGFSTTEIDLILEGENPVPDLADVLDDPALSGPPVSVKGDLWRLGQHLLICEDARLETTLQQLLGGQLAQMVVTDPPYNVRVKGHVQGRAKKQHREFAMASGEMSPADFTSFLGQAMTQAVRFSADGSIHYWFMDWRHMPELLGASMPVYAEWKNLLVWRKSNAGQGAFYRSQHELIAVFKSGSAPHINNFGMGGDGRYRTNVLDYPGGASPDAKRQEELRIHPTVKPVAMIADLIRDCSRRNGLILDLFGGSGTCILAAELTGRSARVVEIDPLYVDLAIRRWQLKTGLQAIHAATGQTFDDSVAGRIADAQR